MLSRVPLARLRHTPRAWLPVLGWSVLALGYALATRAPNGADVAMRGTVGFVVVPLLTYGVVSATLGGVGLRSSVLGLAALGAPRRDAALATILVAMLVSALTCGLVAAVAVGLAHGAADAPLAHDLPASAAVAGAAGATYAAYFCAGSAIGRGAMRGVFLVLDWVLGATGVGSLLVPRGVVTALLGGPAPIDLSRRTCSLVLVVLATSYLALALRLSRDR